MGWKPNTSRSSARPSASGPWMSSQKKLPACRRDAIASRSAGTIVLSASTRNRVGEGAVVSPWARVLTDATPAEAAPHLRHRRLHLSPRWFLLPGTERRTPGGIVNGSRTARPSSPRSFFPLLILSALLLALVAAAPALAYDDWEHGGALNRRATRAAATRPDPVNTACCLGLSRRASPRPVAEPCWECHAPGQDDRRRARPPDGCTVATLSRTGRSISAPRATARRAPTATA